MSPPRSHSCPAEPQSGNGGWAGPPPISGEFVRLFLQSAGCALPQAAPLLQRAGIDLAAFESSHFRLSEQQFTRFLTSLSHHTRDELWGLASRPVPPGTFHTLCRLIVNCRTLGEALVVGGRFYRLVIDDFAVKLRCQDGQAIVWLRTQRQLPPARQATLHGAALFLLYQLMCWLVDRRLPLLAVDMAFGRRRHSGEPLRAYDTRVVRFDQPQTALYLQEHLVSLPIMGDEQRLARFLSEVPRGMLVRYHDEGRLSDKVKSILRTNVGAQLSLEDVAARLHMTPVTLRRHLAQEDRRGFQALRDGVRRRVALELVRQGHVKLETVALRLGFAEYSTFHRAFKRWTGVGPGEYRDTVRPQGAD